MLIVDSGVVVAATDLTDRQHQSCVALLEAEPGPFVTTAMVVAECAYLIQREMGAAVEVMLYQAILDKALLVEDLTARDWTRVQELVTRYADLPLGGTDASIIAIAERLGQTRVATLDRRHFTVIRPAHCDGFELVP